MARKRHGWHPQQPCSMGLLRIFPSQNRKIDPGKDTIMERLSNNRPTGISSNALRTWGLVFLTAGVIGRGLIQARVLGIGQVTAQQLLEIIGASDTAMMLATLSLVLQAMETCAAPIFAILLVTGVQHTSNFISYLIRITGLAVLSELPYNLAIGGRLIALDSRNPVFALVLCLVMLYFYRRYPGFGFQNILIKTVVTAAAVIWGQMLKIDSGSCMVLIVAALWALRARPLYRNFAGAAVTIVCTLISPFYLAAPMGFLAVHAYNGEKSTNSPLVNYLAYPAVLLAAGLVGMLL